MKIADVTRRMGNAILRKCFCFMVYCLCRIAPITNSTTTSARRTPMMSSIYELREPSSAVAWLNTCAVISDGSCIVSVAVCAKTKSGTAESRIGIANKIVICIFFISRVKGRSHDTPSTDAKRFDTVEVGTVKAPAGEFTARARPSLRRDRARRYQCRKPKRRSF